MKKFEHLFSQDPIGAFEKIEEDYTRYFDVSYKISNEEINRERMDALRAGNNLSKEPYLEVLPEYAHILEARFQEQKSDKHGLTISAYNFQEDGDYTEAATLYSCLIESIDYEQDSGAKFSVKGEALTKKVKK